MIDYINRGPDERPLENIPIIGILSKYLQKWLSFKSAIQSAHIAIAFPPYLSICIPHFNGNYTSIRIGWRYDVNWRGYIADVVIKFKMNNRQW